MNGIINIYKEKGYTSFDVVAILRRKLGIKKVGHTGTLDPEAEGVLPICIGKATKVADYITDTKKVYRATMTLGVTTDTQDHTGKVLSQKNVTVSKDAIEKAIASFVGEYEQIPPMYSALKVNGKRLYTLARQGKTIERKARKVMIYDIVVHEVEGIHVDMSIACSKGTYIRTLCADIGDKLQCGAHMSKLVRTKSSLFSIEASHTLDEIDTYIQEERLDEIMLPISQVFNYDKRIIDTRYDKLLYNGNKLSQACVMHNEQITENKRYSVYDEREKFIGIYQTVIIDGQMLLKPIKIFL
ncbi:tRNA pseudouridine(55) synthase TruB [Vallitalea pronyensis]|uniref:tRNA pseudouridine synthase B n=1 Tax=Vallitalea pronyensis TaxID=1348613 RepID=A0A8J8SH27_9FIRM|nr:tRNA pseudouridine(55) synthase TruB [Vallitalea pronyensis]QUI22994.1 tRNA pseudouridine(55) synthase TruB [Vallitalea pronyensis]